MLTHASRYVRAQHLLLLRDSPQKIDYHVMHDDYFAFLATCMGFLEEALARCSPHLAEAEQKLAHELRRDLRYVQANYKISPRALVDIQTMRGKGNLLTKQYR